MKLGEYLLKHNYITKNELNDALAKQRDTTNVPSKQLGNILLSLGIVTEEEITKALTEHSNGHDMYTPILNNEITKELTTLFPIEQFRPHNMVPIVYNKQTQTLTLGTTVDNPPAIDLSVSTLKERFPKVRIQVFKVLEHSYAIFFNRYAELSNKDFNLPTIPVNAVEKLRQIYRAAIELGSSDLHIFNTDDKVKVQFRVSRTLQDYDRVDIPKSMKGDIDRALANQCNLSQMELSLGQIDASANDLLGDAQWKARVNMQETVRGFAHVLRLIPRFSVIKGIHSLNLSPGPSAYLKDLTQARSGLILVTGPMGSGKNWTITSMIVEVNDGKKYIVSVEDPVEIFIDGVNQVSIDSKNTSFGSFGRGILRQDCDVMYLGEIRDIDSLDVAIRGGLGGMLVVSTLHTKSVGEIYPRMESIDGTAYKKAMSALTGMINQRLVKKLCPDCKQEIKFNDLPDRDRLIFQSSLKEITGKSVKYSGKLYKAVGCPTCKGSGYKGAVVCMEYLKIDSTIRQELLNCTDALVADRKIRLKTIEDGTAIEFDGLQRLKEGLTDVQSLVAEGVFKP